MNKKFKTPILPKTDAPMAVIDIGATSIRMVIAQRNRQGRINVLESLQRAVSIGKDSFVQGSISPATIEECVKILRDFRTVFDSYSSGGSIRSIATSAVREAVNRDAVIDRIYIATGIWIEVIDEEEIIRFFYHCVRYYLENQPPLKKTAILVVEAGGGNTQVLLLKNHQMVFSRSYRLGMFRMRETLQHHRTPSTRLRELIEQQIRVTTDQIIKDLPRTKNLKILIMGNDARFAASNLSVDGRGREKLTRLPTNKLRVLDDALLDLTPEEIVTRYKLSYFEAETVAPALLVYVQLARALKSKDIYATTYTVRDGVLLELYAFNTWTDEFNRQIVRSALQLGTKYSFERRHAEQVARTCRWLFTALVGEHRLPQRYELILYIAAILHDIGNFISVSGHHKHSYYILSHSTLFGLGAADIQLIALIARYHRRAVPSKTHPEYNILDKSDRIIVTKLAALLRIADALNRSHRPHQTFSSTIGDGRFVITAEQAGDLTIEQFALKDKAQLFRQMFGLEVVLHRHGIDRKPAHETN